MRKFTVAPDVEHSGAITIAFVKNLQSAETTPVFQKYDLINLDPSRWYPASRFMDALNELAESDDFSSTMIAIGLEIAKQVPMGSDGVDPSFEDALVLWDKFYQRAHRGENCDIGGITLDKVAEYHYKTIHTHIYPDDFSYGIAYGLARRYLPKATNFKVFFDADAKQRDRDGAASTIIHVTWSPM